MLDQKEGRSAAFYTTLAQVHEMVKPLLADRLAAAVEAAEHGITVLCEQGRCVY